jgi:hypothetical protein
MLTKTDLSNLQKIFVTREEFNFGLQNLRNDVITRLDALMHELQAMREEMTVFAYRQSEHSDQLENHATRLAGLETKLDSPKSATIAA